MSPTCRNIDVIRPFANEDSKCCEDGSSCTAVCDLKRAKEGIADNNRIDIERIGPCGHRDGVAAGGKRRKGWISCCRGNEQLAVCPSCCNVYVVRSFADQNTECGQNSKTRARVRRN